MSGIAAGSLLIVDDEPGIVTLLKNILSPIAAEIHTATNGQEALEKIRAHAIDAVLSDINMPTMNGLDLLARMRFQHMETPFVFVTGYGDKEKTREALRLGATDFLDKPFEPEIVLDVMKKALELGRTIRRVEDDLESLYNSDKIPADMKLRLRTMKKAIVMMRYATDIYKK